MVAWAWVVGDATITLTIPETWTGFLDAGDKFVYVGQTGVDLAAGKKSPTIRVRLVLKDLTRDLTISVPHSAETIRKKVAQPPTEDWLLLYKGQ